MARPLRRKSLSGIYHVTIRGVNKQRIFEQPDDYDAVYRILRYVRDMDTRREPVEEPNFFLYAYCIMDNHIHLLIQPNNGCELGRIISRITQTYAMYFNQTYERVGHLFQDRYKSKEVEDADYFFTSVHYIHHNPVKAGLCRLPRKYAHSSYNELVSNDGFRWRKMEKDSAKTTKRGLTLNGSFSPRLCVFPDCCTREEMEAEDRRYEEAKKRWEQDQTLAKPKLRSMMLLAITREEVAEYVMTDRGEPDVQGLLGQLKVLTQENDNDLCKYLRSKLNWQTVEEQDKAIVESLLEMTGTANISEFQQLDKKTMRTALAYVRDSGINASRLSRLTGISIGVIRYAKVCFPTEEKTEE